MTLVLYPLLEMFTKTMKTDHAQKTFGSCFFFFSIANMLFGKPSFLWKLFFSCLTFACYFTFLTKTCSFRRLWTQQKHPAKFAPIVKVSQGKTSVAWCSVLRTPHAGHVATRDELNRIWLDILWVSLPSLNLFTSLKPLMLHTSTEQPYPSTQHESGVQPRYQPWEQPWYEPCSGLPSAWWVPVGAGSRSREPLPPLQTLVRDAAEWNDLLSLLCCLVVFFFFFSSSLVPLRCPPPSACLNFGSFRFWYY